MKNRSVIIIPIFMGITFISLTIGMVAYQNSISERAIRSYECLTRISLLTQQARVMFEEGVSDRKKDQILSRLQEAKGLSDSFPAEDAILIKRSIDQMIRYVKDFYTLSSTSQTGLDNHAVQNKLLFLQKDLTDAQKEIIENYYRHDRSIQSVSTQYLEMISALSDSNAQSKFWYRLGWLITITTLTAGITYRVYKMAKAYNVVLHDAERRFKYETERIRSITSFIDAITNGCYEEKIDLDASDGLSKPLIGMKARLVQVAEKDREMNRVTQGLAQLGGMLQNTSISADQLIAEVTKFIVHYSNSNQGCLFILKKYNNDQYLELTSTYAYDRQKYSQKRFGLGEGLAGQAVLEGQTIYITQVPPTYIHITSGLGEALPRAVVVVPLLFNKQVYGVMELASFSSYKPFEIELLEKFAERIASFISTMQVNRQTRELLEQSQQQAEQLRSQEEEMRQNMEELTATQEQLSRQMREMKQAEQNFIIRDNAFSTSMLLSEADRSGTILYVNEKMVEVSKYRREVLIGKPHSTFRHPDMPNELFHLLWQTIGRGKVFKAIMKNRAEDGTHYWVDVTILPILDKDGSLSKYISTQYFITNESAAVILYNQQANIFGLPTASNGVLSPEVVEWQPASRT